MSVFEPKRPTQKTYSHLLKNRRIPSEYELSTTDLLYYVKKGGFEVSVPLQSWYNQYQKKARITCQDWSAFKDARETTYPRYTNIQKTQESFVNAVLQMIEDSNYDSQLSPEWLETFSRLFAPLRYPWHGFQMISAYIAQMAPEGKITITSMFQSADEMRRIQRVAYRIAQLRKVAPEFGKNSQTLWEQDPVWQPLRKGIETLLVTYDWTEAFLGLNLCLKPVVDYLFMEQLPLLAKKKGDHLLAEISYSLRLDNLWQRQWSQQLAELLFKDNQDNKIIIEEWLLKGLNIAKEAVLPFVPFFEMTESELLSKTVFAQTQELKNLGFNIIS